MSAQLAELLEDRAQYQEQLDLVLGSLNDDPGNEELLMLKEELQSALQMIDDAIADLKPQRNAHHGRKGADEADTASKEQEAEAGAGGAAAAAPEAPAATPTGTQKHAGSGSRAAAHDEPPLVFKVNESVLARWVSGDKAFYPARIMSVTGSSAAPMYTVKFKSYDTIETLQARDIRPLATHAATGAGAAASSASSANKRKADGSAAGLGVDVPASNATSAASTASVSPVVTPPPPPPTMTTTTAAAPPPPPPPPSALSAPSSVPPPPPASSYMHTAVSTSASPPPPPPPSAPQPAEVRRVFGSRAIDRFSAGMVSSAAAQLYPEATQMQEQQRRANNGYGSGSGSGSSAWTREPAGGVGSTSSGGAGNVSMTPLGADDAPPAKKFKKIKATKQLEAGKSKWQEFSSKAKSGKAGGKKESMFRTPEGVHGRVGFTGSGQSMRKDVTRSRHTYQTNDDLD